MNVQQTAKTLSSIQILQSLGAWQDPAKLCGFPVWALIADAHNLNHTKPSKRTVDFVGLLMLSE